MVKCKECNSEGFEPSVTGEGCSFCDGTEGGNPPQPCKHGYHGRCDLCIEETTKPLFTKKKWLGTWPANCDQCKVDLTKEKYFCDARTRRGPWGLFCPECFEWLCDGLGIGRGQKYDSKTLEKIGG